MPPLQGQSRLHATGFDLSILVNSGLRVFTYPVLRRLFSDCTSLLTSRLPAADLTKGGFGVRWVRMGHEGVFQYLLAIFSPSVQVHSIQNNLYSVSGFNI